jgi:hypothetical protein
MHSSPLPTAIAEQPKFVLFPCAGAGVKLLLFGKRRVIMDEVI